MMMAGRTDHGSTTVPCIRIRDACSDCTGGAAAGWLAGSDAFAPFFHHQPTSLHHTPMIYGRHNNFSFIKELYT